MKTINYIFRKQLEGAISIEKLFGIIIKNVSSDFEKKILVNPHPLNPIGVLKSIFFFVRKKADINHITGDIHWLAIFLNPTHTILTIHDLVGYHKYHGIVKFIYFAFWIYLPIRRVKYITVISEKTKKEITNLLPWAEKKITVIPNCVTIESYQKASILGNEIPKILTIGTLPNKNLERVIEATEGLSVELNIVGKLTQNQEQLLRNKNILYKNYYNIPEEQLVSLYRNADILCFPSTYEGFGLPILEGQANDCAVITSDLYPMKEVAADGAILIDPYNANAIKKAILTIIENKELTQKLIDKGRENVKKYTVENIVNQYQNLYYKILKTKSSC